MREEFEKMAAAGKLERHHIEHIDEIRGRASLKQAPDPGAFERAHYIRTLHSWHA